MAILTKNEVHSRELINEQMKKKIISWRNSYFNKFTYLCIKTNIVFKNWVIVIIKQQVAIMVWGWKLFLSKIGIYTTLLLTPVNP